MQSVLGTSPSVLALLKSRTATRIFHPNSISLLLLSVSRGLECTLLSHYLKVTNYFSLLYFLYIRF